VKGTLRFKNMLFQRRVLESDGFEYGSHGRDQHGDGGRGDRAEAQDARGFPHPGGGGVDRRL
jgi:hypothetical protein